LLVDIQGRNTSQGKLILLGVDRYILNVLKNVKERCGVSRLWCRIASI
jgi:hypothetical protein